MAFRVGCTLVDNLMKRQLHAIAIGVCSSLVYLIFVNAIVTSVVCLRLSIKQVQVTKLYHFGNECSGD